MKTDIEETSNMTMEPEYVVLDTETTGLFKKDRIIEIGIVAFKGNTVLEEWSTLLNPNRDIGPTHIHGITPSMVSLAPTFEEVVNDLARLLNGRILVCHNASFDKRMLLQEFSRLGIEVDLGKPFCTMLASKRLLPSSCFKLVDACESLAIEVTGAHSALGDARMTQNLYQFVNEDEQLVQPVALKYVMNQIPVTRVQRTIFEAGSNDAIDRIRAFTKKVPFPTTDQSEVAYLLLLNMAMDDLSISADESIELRDWAEKLGISQARLLKLHEAYLNSYVQAALRDGVISPLEREIISNVARALSLETTIPDSALEIPVNDKNLEPGKTICFTGAAVNSDGVPLSREELEAMAAIVGLHPVSSVTKRGCDFVVAADENSMSGKAKKARLWGIEVLSVERFISFCSSEKV